MRGLTTTERRVLELCHPGSLGGDYTFDAWEVAIVNRLLIRGLVRVWLEDGDEWVETTRRGELALRCCTQMQKRLHGVNRAAGVGWN